MHIFSAVELQGDESIPRVVWPLVSRCCRLRTCTPRSGLSSPQQARRFARKEQCRGKINRVSLLEYDRFTNAVI